MLLLLLLLLSTAAGCCCWALLLGTAPGHGTSLLWRRRLVARSNPGSGARVGMRRLAGGPVCGVPSGQGKAGGRWLAVA